MTGHNVILSYGFFAATEELWIGDRIGDIRSYDVGSHAFRRLIGHLDSILQHGDWEVRGGVGRQPQPEIWMGCVRVELLADLLEGGHPGDSQVAVLEHNPGALFLA